MSRQIHASEIQMSNVILVNKQALRVVSWRHDQETKQVELKCNTVLGERQTLDYGMNDAVDFIDPQDIHTHVVLWVDTPFQSIEYEDNRTGDVKTLFCPEHIARALGRMERAFVDIGLDRFITHISEDFD